MAPRPFPLPAGERVEISDMEKSLLPDREKAFFHLSALPFELGLKHEVFFPDLPHLFKHLPHLIKEGHLIDIIQHRKSPRSFDESLTPDSRDGLKPVTPNDPRSPYSRRKVLMGIELPIIVSQMTTAKAGITPVLNGPLDLLFHCLADHPFDQSRPFLLSQ